MANVVGTPFDILLDDDSDRLEKFVNVWVLYRLLPITYKS